VLDRHREDFAQCAWSLRRVLTEDINAGFAKWVASADRGRFLVLAPIPGSTIEEIFVFIDDVDELLRHVSEKTRTFSMVERRNPDVGIMVTPDLFERFKALSTIDLAPPRAS
jgi:hypothetical protein